MVVGHDHVHPELPGHLDLYCGGDAAVDREDEPDAVGRELLDRRGGDAVALLEAARQVPRHVGTDLSQREHGEGGGADAVDVVIAVDADFLAPFRGEPQARHRGHHVAQEERIVADTFRLEEGTCNIGVAEAAAHEHGRDGLREAERGGQLLDVRERDRLDLPACGNHAATIGPASDGDVLPSPALP